MSETPERQHSPSNLSRLSVSAVLLDLTTLIALVSCSSPFGGSTLLFTKDGYLGIADDTYWSVDPAFAGTSLRMFDPDKPSRFMLKRETDSVGRTFQFTRGQTRENAPLASIPSSVQRAKYWVISEVVTLDTPTNDHKGYIAAVGKNVGDGPLYAVDANGYHYFSFAMKHQANEGEISQDEKILWRFKMKAIP